MSSDELGDVSKAYMAKLLQHFLDNGLSEKERVESSQIIRPPGVAIAYITITKPERFAGKWQVNNSGCKRVERG